MGRPDRPPTVGRSGFGLWQVGWGCSAMLAGPVGFDRGRDASADLGGGGVGHFDLPAVHNGGVGSREARHILGGSSATSWRGSAVAGRGGVGQARRNIPVTTLNTSKQ